MGPRGLEPRTPFSSGMARGSSGAGESVQSPSRRLACRAAAPATGTVQRQPCLASLCPYRSQRTLEGRVVVAAGSQGAAIGTRERGSARAPGIPAWRELLGSNQRPLPCEHMPGQLADLGILSATGSEQGFRTSVDFGVSHCFAPACVRSVSDTVYRLLARGPRSDRSSGARKKTGWGG